jgi:signal transduction histidine kinase
MTTTALAGVNIRALDVLVDVLSHAEGSSTGDEFFGQLCEAVCRLVGLRRAIIFRYDPALRKVRASGTYGIDLEPFARSHLTLESAPIAARAVHEDKVIEVDGDVLDQIPPEYAELVAEPTRLICAPIGAGGREIGVIVGERPMTAPPLSDEERYMLWTLAKAVALATAARIAATQSEKANQLQHRINLARELHESVMQRLFGVSMALDGPGSLPAAARRRCAEETQAALDDLKRTLQRPLGREPPPTQTTFHAELARLKSIHPELGVVVPGSDHVEVPPRLEPLVQSVLAEAIRNAHKHAAPTNVEVGLEHQGDSLVLKITNDRVNGRGDVRGIGLRLAALEALHYGGILEFGPHGGDSWQVRLVVPVDD